MSQTTYRYKVQGANGEASEAWRVWVAGAEVYVAPRSVGNQYKLSIHSTGQCQVGLSSELRETLVHDAAWEGKSRLFDVWHIDVSEATAPISLVVELLHAESLLDSLPVGRAGRVESVPCMPNHIVSIGIAKAMVARGVTLASPDPTFRELARMHCSDGSTVFVLHRQVHEPPAYREQLRARFWATRMAEPTPANRMFGQRPQGPMDAAIRCMFWDGESRPKRWHDASARKLYDLGIPDPLEAR